MFITLDIMFQRCSDWLTWFYSSYWFVDITVSEMTKKCKCSYIGEVTIITTEDTMGIYLCRPALLLKCGKLSSWLWFFGFSFLRIQNSLFLNMLKYCSCMGSDFSHLICEIVQQCPQLSGFCPFSWKHQSSKQLLFCSCRLLWKGNWFIQEKSCKILSLIVRYHLWPILH